MTSIFRLEHIFGAVAPGAIFLVEKSQSDTKIAIVAFVDAEVDWENTRRLVDVGWRISAKCANVRIMASVNRRCATLCIVGVGTGQPSVGPHWYAALD